LETLWLSPGHTFGSPGPPLLDDALVLEALVVLLVLVLEALVLEALVLEALACALVVPAPDPVVVPGAPPVPLVLGCPVVAAPVPVLCRSMPPVWKAQAMTST
jgi:hypothetical protein